VVGPEIENWFEKKNLRSSAEKSAQICGKSFLNTGAV
jgi:hypothetical protein